MSTRENLTNVDPYFMELNNFQKKNHYHKTFDSHLVQFHQSIECQLRS